MDPATIEDLRRKVETLKSMDRSKMRARVALLEHRGVIENEVPRLATELDVDPEVVLRVIGPAWQARLAATDMDSVSGDEFVTIVRDDVRAIIEALVDGRTSVGEPVRDQAIAEVIKLGTVGEEVHTIAAIFTEMSKALVSSPT